MLNKNDFKVFNVFLFFWLTLGWLAFILTLAGVFYWWILVIFIAIIVAFGFRFFLEPLLKVSGTFIIVNLSLFIIVTAFSIYVSPTIFSGRDQGSISEAAIRLAQNNQLEFSTSTSDDFFKINSTPEKKLADCFEKNNITQNNLEPRQERIVKFYCHTVSSGKALNFPGFFYTPQGNLVTQFPLVYISWLSFFYAFLGIFGIVIANAILFYIFLLSMFMLSCKMTKTIDLKLNKSLCVSVITLMIIITSFSFSWFFKFTLTENMALALLWSGILQAIYLTESKLERLSGKTVNLLIMFMSFGLLIFTRIEGIAFFISAILVLLFYKNTAAYFRRNFFKVMFPLIVMLSVFFIWNLVADVYFYKAILKAFIKDITENSSNLNSAYSTPTFDLFKSFAFYGILAPLILGLFSVIYFFQRRNYQKLIPFFIVLPAFIYIISPQITPDLPWMLRRFVFAILPVAILYSTLLLYAFLKSEKHSNKAIYYKIVLAMVIALNIPAFIHFFTFTPGENLLKETEKISQKFTDDDLVLVDQRASGDGKQMISAPMNFLFKKNAVYFFNPDDFKEIDTEKYNKIYLIVPKNKIEYYQKSFLGNRLTLLDEYSIKTNALVTNSNDDSFPAKKDILVTGSIFEISK